MRKWETIDATWEKKEIFESCGEEWSLLRHIQPLPWWPLIFLEQAQQWPTTNFHKKWTARLERRLSEDRAIVKVVWNIWGGKDDEPMSKAFKEGRDKDLKLQHTSISSSPLWSSWLTWEASLLRFLLSIAKFEVKEMFRSHAELNQGWDRCWEVGGRRNEDDRWVERERQFGPRRDKVVKLYGGVLAHFEWGGLCCPWLRRRCHVVCMSCLRARVACGSYQRSFAQHSRQNFPLRKRWMHACTDEECAKGWKEIRDSLLFLTIPSFSISYHVSISISISISSSFFVYFSLHYCPQFDVLYFSFFLSFVFCFPQEGIYLPHLIPNSLNQPTLPPSPKIEIQFIPFPMPSTHSIPSSRPSIQLHRRM